MAGSASGRQDEGASFLIGYPSRKDVAVSLLCLVDKHNENRQQRRPERWSYLFFARSEYRQPCTARKDFVSAIK